MPLSIKLIIAITVFFFFQNAVAQKRDTAVYYLANSGKFVSTKDSADYFLLILPPDTNINKNLSVVHEYYKNGKIRLVATSMLNELKLQGAAMYFFPNGRRMSIYNYENGKLTGDLIEYYPNGRFYNRKSYVKTVTEQPELQLRDCNDSTGKVLALNGNGKWIKFDEGFKNIVEEQQVEDGHEVNYDIGAQVDSDTTLVIKEDKKGNVIDVTSPDNHSKNIYSNKVYLNSDRVPEFPGGLEALGQFIARNIHYPSTARKNKTQGKVLVSFVIDKDGTVTDIKIKRGIGDGCDEEALRVIAMMPKWRPGVQNGKLVRVAYSVPLAFTLNR